MDYLEVEQSLGIIYTELANISPRCREQQLSMMLLNNQRLAFIKMLKNSAKDRLSLVECKKVADLLFDMYRRTGEYKNT